MRVEVEYLVRKRMIVECGDITESRKILSGLDWIGDGKVIIKKPEIVNKIVVDGTVFKDVQDVKQRQIVAAIKTSDEWLEELNIKIIILQEKHNNWSYEKCKFMAKKTMPILSLNDWV